MVQADYVLPKIVRTWPNLVLLGTVRCSTHVRFTGVDLVDTLLVPIQVVFGGESLRPGAARYLALVWFFMAKFMFAVPLQSFKVKSRVLVENTCVRTCS